MITTPKRLIAPGNDYVWIGFDIVEHLVPVLRQGDGAGGASIVRPASNIPVHVFKVSILMAPPGNRFKQTRSRNLEFRSRPSRIHLAPQPRGIYERTSPHDCARERSFDWPGSRTRKAGLSPTAWTPSARGGRFHVRGGSRPRTGCRSRGVPQRPARMLLFAFFAVPVPFSGIEEIVPHLSCPRWLAGLHRRTGFHQRRRTSRSPPPILCSLPLQVFAAPMR